MHIDVKLGEKAYTIEYLDTIEGLTKQKTDFEKTFVLIDAKVQTIYGNRIQKLFPDAHFIRIPSGERSKSFKLLEKLCETLVREKVTRRSRLWAFGGGVVGDLTGFLAGITLRGIPFVQVPTTLLAMVDSSVGGKTAINLKAGKNLVGVFHQPSHVFVIPEFLQSLTLRELQCGLSEAIKSALIANFDFVTFLERAENQSQMRERNFLTHISYESIRIKAEIVAQDEKEQTIRVFLNFGHTLAHALESYSQYRHLLHGEAVAIGMRFAALLSMRKGYLTQIDYQRIVALLKAYGLPTQLQFVKGINPKNFSKLIELMRADKKNTQSSIRFVLLDKIGKARLSEPVSEQELLAALKEFWNVD